MKKTPNVTRIPTDKTLVKHISKACKELRLSCNCKVSELAEDLGIPAGTIYRFEQGYLNNGNIIFMYLTYFNPSKKDEILETAYNYYMDEYCKY